MSVFVCFFQVEGQVKSVTAGTTTAVDKKTVASVAAMLAPQDC